MKAIKLGDVNKSLFSEPFFEIFMNNLLFLFGFLFYLVQMDDNKTLMHLGQQNRVTDAFSL